MGESLIAVTGATGQLGGLVVESLLGRGVPAGRIVAGVRDEGKAAALAARGVQVRVADYARPETLGAAFDGVGRLLLVSGNEVGRRVPQHENVVRAAVKAGVELIAYTSILRADTSTMILAEEHRGTEEVVRASGLPYVLLRNGWYYENYYAFIKQAVAHGALIGSAGEGRVSAAARGDYAEAAAAVLAGEGHANKVYELAGDESFGYAELAAEVARQAGREVVYKDLPADAFAQTLTGFGVPEPLARALADADLGIKRGELFDDGRELSVLIGRPTVKLADAVAEALK
ncbi:MAG: SDR family oxidoreductase [Acidobacteria bacterium]|nr:SDR family oxidoreductase [Acidobacteriota bacterium]